MKTLIKTVSIVSMIAFSGFSLAECPSSLSAEEMYDCIVIEGAGSTYKPKHENAQSEAAQVQKPAEKHPDQQAKTGANGSHL